VHLGLMHMEELGTAAEKKLANKFSARQGKI
jgi:hypothetical protein